MRGESDMSEKEIGHIGYSPDFVGKAMLGDEKKVINLEKIRQQARRDGFLEGVEKVRKWIRNESMPGISDDTALINREKFEQAIIKFLTEHREDENKSTLDKLPQ